LPRNAVWMMSEVLDRSLQTIVKGAGLVLTGTAIGMLLMFVSRIILVRYLTQTEYGLYSLGYVLFEVFLVVSTLGLETGLARQIGFHRGKGDTEKAASLVLSGLQIGAVFGTLCALALFLASDAISSDLFHTPELSRPVKVFAVAVPFFLLTHVLTSVFRGFDRAQPAVYFRDILRNVLFCLFLGVVVAFNLSFTAAVWGFVASVIVALVAFATYAIKKAPVSLKRRSVPTGLARKELLLFSLPLFAVVLLQRIATWTDTLMIGGFMTPDDVGLYNAALPLAHLLPLLLDAPAFLFLPLMSQLYARGQNEEIRRSYTVVTKWIFAASLPVFLVFALFPEAALNILFGSRYIPAAPALQILSLGFFTHNILGLNGVTLMAAGKTRFLGWSALAAVILNVALNVVLIPPLGIKGAAIATASSLALRNVLISVKLYSSMRVHPFTSNYLKPAIASTAIVAVIYVLARDWAASAQLWLLPLLFVLFLGAYALAVLLTRSFDREDIMMLLAIEDRSGIRLTALRRILRRFV
jgi:O-antigen/teichoic acid export membrane protein